MKKALVAGSAIVALLVAPLLAALMVVMLATGATAATYCGPGGVAEQVSGVDLDAEQLASARTIVETTAAVRMPQKAAAVAVAVAMQESSLRNITHGHLDSIGLFQQRPSQGWGTPAQILDPVYSTTKFLHALSGVDGWQAMPLTVAAQTVQRSAFPDAYAKYEQMATDLAARFWPAGAPVDGTPDPTQPANPSTNPSTGWTASCNGGDGLTDTDGGGIPAGYVPPTNAQQATVVKYALEQVGEPYVWGGTGPDGWDCSGLMLKAWAAAGVAIPRTTFDQVKTGAPVPTIADAQPGDLLFIAGSDGTRANPGHVGMFIGQVNGTAYLVHAPRTGMPIVVKPVSAWDGLIVAIRRPGGAT